MHQKTVCSKQHIPHTNNVSATVPDNGYQSHLVFVTLTLRLNLLKKTVATKKNAIHPSRL